MIDTTQENKPNEVDDEKLRNDKDYLELIAKEAVEELLKFKERA